MILRRTCKEAAALLVAREDRPLPTVERLALRLHLAACQACPRFARQLSAMREALKLWREDTGENPPDAPKSGTNGQDRG
jgi:anti-sigma factor RsiW